MIHKKNKDPRVIVGPKVGEDAAVIELENISLLISLHLKDFEIELQKQQRKAMSKE